jgi:hypothetical protein
VKESEANDDGLDEEECRVDLMIALVARTGGDGYASQKKDHTNDISRSEFEEMRDTFEQSIEEIDQSVESKNDEEGAMIGVEMHFVINGFINRAFPREKWQ